PRWRRLGRERVCSMSENCAPRFDRNPRACIVPDYLLARIAGAAVGAATERGRTRPKRAPGEKASVAQEHAAARAAISSLELNATLRAQRARVEARLALSSLTGEVW